MIARLDCQLAVRARLATLSVCTTGTTTLAATATGYTRTTGSFLTDGFEIGMEVTPSGFARNTAVNTITDVAATTLTMRGRMTVELAASGRSLSVGLPSRVMGEDDAFTPSAGAPYVAEQWLPGPSAITHDGYVGQVELRPMAVVRIYVPEDSGIRASGRYADAVLALFPPGTLMPVAGGGTLVVRADVAPYPGQRSKSSDPDGWSVLPVTIPLTVRSLSVPS